MFRGVGLVVLLQIACVVHAFKTGRPYWWFWVILIGGPIGCTAYLIVEVLPEMRRSPSVKRIGSDLATAVNPSRNVRRLEEELEITDTVKNRQLLAEAYSAAGRYEEATGMYRSCLKGFYEDDPPLMLGLATTQFLAEMYQETRESVEKLARVDAKFRPMERCLLLARTLEGLEDLDAALAEYEPLSRQYPGEEAKCRYAMLLDRTGQAEKAREIYRKILLNAKRSPRYYRKAQRHWINLAKQNMNR